MMQASEVHAEIAATKAALANLKASLGCVFLPKTAPKSRRIGGAEGRANELRFLDRLYSSHTGAALRTLDAPRYLGPMYEWKSPRIAVTRRAIDCLIRLRRSPEVGVHMTTHFVVLNYLASIWPSDLEWPQSIPRPIPKKEAA